MKVNILLAIFGLLVVSNSLRISHHEDNNGQPIIVGGYSPISVTNLSDDAKEVDQFIRSKHTDLQGAKLISAQRQVVAGFNYHYKYQSADGKKEWDIVVYKNLKGKLLENGFSFTETLPNGQKITAIADPSSAFVGANNKQSPVNSPMPLPGGYFPVSVDSLTNEAKEVDQFIREKHSDLKDAILVSSQAQVVAGMNYHNIYESADGKTEWDIVVYKNLQGELSESQFSFTQTLPNGQKVTAIADPASAFTGANNQEPSQNQSGQVNASTNDEQTGQNSDENDNSSVLEVFLNVFPNAIAPRPAS